MCLIEANQPVYPLDIVRQMRDQRAMLIQTSVSNQTIIERVLTLVMPNCLFLLFIRSKLGLLTQFPAFNDEKYVYFCISS